MRGRIERRIGKMFNQVNADEVLGESLEDMAERHLERSIYPKLPCLPKPGSKELAKMREDALIHSYKILLQSGVLDS